MPEDLLTVAAVVDVAEQLVRIPSVNPSLAPDEGRGEAEVAGFACDWLERHGIRARLEEVAPGRPNVVGELDGEPGPTLVMCAHLDTVGTAGMTIPAFEPRFEAGRLYGRGAYDMKGSAAAVLCAAATLAREPNFRGRLLVALVADEEYASIGAADFVRRHAADACILTEASGGDLVLAHKGFLWAEVVTRGRAAHGSRWDLGVSAVARMGEVIVALDRLDRERLRAREHPLTGPASMHCATVKGGVGLSTYAPECRLEVERRFIPGETAERALKEIDEALRAAGVEAEVRHLLDRPALECPPDSAIARCVRDAATKLQPSPPRDIGVAYWMDAALFAAAGIPTVDLGPHGQGAHEAVEWVDAASLASLAQVLAECGRTFADYTHREV